MNNDVFQLLREMTPGPYKYETRNVSTSSLSTLFSGGSGDLFHVLAIVLSPNDVGRNFDIVRIEDGVDTVDIMDNTVDGKEGMVMFQASGVNYKFQDGLIPIDYMNTGTMTVRAQLEGSGSGKATLIYKELN